MISADSAGSPLYVPRFAALLLGATELRACLERAHSKRIFSRGEPWQCRFGRRTFGVIGKSLQTFHPQMLGARA